MDYNNEMVEWTLPSYTVEQEFFSDTLQIPTYLTKLGDYNLIRKYFFEGENTFVGVADTGIANNILSTEFANRDIKAQDFTNSPSGSNDVSGHGSHVACHIASSKIGLAPKATVRIAKVLGDNGSGSSTGIANGIDWIIAEFKASGLKAGLINLSLGGGYSTAIHNSIKRAEAAGMIVFAAIGNSGGTENDERGGYPGRLEQTLGIGAVDYNNRPATFSSRSANTDIVGYGVSVLSCGIQANQYRRLSGTSMATPCEVGIAALILSKMATLTDKYPLINSKAKYMEFVESCIDDLYLDGKDRATGYGKIDLDCVIKKIGFIKIDEPVDEEPIDEEPIECPPSKEITKYLIPRRINTTIERMTWYDKNGVVEKVEEEEKNQVVVYQLLREDEKEI